MWEGVGDRTELQHIDPYCISFPFSRAAQLGAWGPTLLGAGFLYRILSPTDLNFNCSIGGLGAQPLWVLVFSNASYIQLLWSPTDWTSSALSHIIVQRPPSCGRHKLHSFNPSMVKVIFWYSSTGCTCYLHKCISYFDSPAGSEVNIQQRAILIVQVSALNIEVSFGRYFFLIFFYVL